MRKNVFWLFIIILLVWNIILTIFVFDTKNNNGNAINTTIIENEVNGFSTDLTKVIEEVSDKVVTIETDLTSGSGVIVENTNGTIYIATNYHVVENANNITAYLDNLDKLSATLVGYDAISDVAILSINAEYHIEPITFGNSDNLKSGEYIVAIGSPISYEYRGSLSFGVISSPYRYMDLNVDDKSYTIGMIQSDIELNSGNSGGPICNMAGELIGLNTLELKVDDADNLSFSLPSNELKYICHSIITSGRVNKIDFGIKNVALKDMPNYQKSNLGIRISQTNGIFVSDIKSESLAYSMGIRQGDIILKINDTLIDSNDNLLAILYSDIDFINVEVLRNDQIVELESVINLND